ncbi:tetratricopeptide repeat protein [Actinomadura sp. WMMA1423]|uniref:CHAT domain-containing tetratricopeptide repeat protein n=1 Tax=Actinomadura sp. WMMA1423 TaxID=2591108 RepID=UPI001146E59C|nr:tetratricopeptide repeat protein [Actinomadura sp. WMMA1423]
MAEQGNDRLLIKIRDQGRVSVAVWWQGVDQPETAVEDIEMVWPLDAEDIEDLRWYLEDYLRHPYAVYSDRGRAVAAEIPRWGESIFRAVFGDGPALAAYAAVRASGNRPELVIESTTAPRLGLPWELLRDPRRGRPLVLDGFSLTRRLSASDLLKPFPTSGDRLRVLMVISRPSGEDDVGYQMIARPLLERLDAVRGNVDLVVLRPPTLDQLQTTLLQAAEAGEPFQIVHFDGHGVFGDGQAPAANWDPLTFTGPAPQGMLVFEKPEGGPDHVDAGRVAQVLAAARVPVVVLNACQSGQIGSQVEAAVATRLIKDGAASVVAMAYSVYAVAAAEFMAVFYERLFAGDRIADAMTAGRLRLALADQRPSPKGKLPLQDWIIPVHYRRRDISFPHLRADRPKGTPSLEKVLNQLRNQSEEEGSSQGAGLDAVEKFVGRDGLLFILDAAARLQPVVVLHGPGGTGKTELAKAFGRWWRDTGGVDSPELVFWDSFEPGVASFGLDGVVTSLGLKVFGSDFAALDQLERRKTVEKLLGDHRILWLWDNFETVRSMPDPTGATPPLGEDEADELRGFLHRVAAKGRSAIVITSRSPEDWLGPQVRRIEVGGLNRDEAVLYADHLLEPYPGTRAKRERRGFEDLMQWLDGHPLSMRLTLPLLDANTPERLLEALKGTEPLPVRDEGDRTTSLAASIAYSFTHLPDQDQQAITALALFHTITDSDVLGVISQSPECPQRLRGLSSEEWLGLLRRATEVGLLTELGTGMFRLHPALPSYLTAHWKRLDPDGFTDEHAATMRALLDAYAVFAGWLAEQWKSENAQTAVAMVELHRRNLSGMLGYAVHHQCWNHATNIASLLNDYWELRGLNEEARAWVDRAQDILEDPPGTPPRLDSPAGDLWAFLTHSQANRLQAAGQLKQAEDTYRTLLHAIQQLPETDHTRANTAVLYHQLGMTAQGQGGLDQAENWYRQSLTIKEQRRDRSGMASSYHQLGITAQLRGDLDQAEHWYRQSLTFFEELGDRPGMAGSYHQLGTTAQLRGDLDQAENWYRQSLIIKEQLRNRPGMASTYHQLGTTAQHRGDLNQALHRYRQALTIFEELRDRPRTARCYHQLGMIAQRRGDLDQAELWYRQAITIFQELGDRPGMVQTYGQFGLLAEDRGDPQKALEWIIRCIALFDEYPHSATGPAPHHLERLTRQLGMNTLRSLWHATTERPLPSDIRTAFTAPDETDPDESGTR